MTMQITLPGNPLDGVTGRVVRRLAYPHWPGALLWIDVGFDVIAVSSLYCVEVWR